ncbi:MAG: undecaprenyldiphospho-muramoylpentapeptide beta-N-acetylglucosaminyltransferase [Verrucomicrobiales bacterium]|nr:undecaprenyldiphospho-muramoylpentapeptide beta-N-acetylglucosaminyltransferase [Verrucomicrobiales bacterium]
MSEPTQPLRLVIACGGTGGHLFPGIAVAQAARARGHESLVLISEKQIDALASEGHGDLRFEKIPAIAMPRLLSLQMPKFLLRFLRTVKACKGLLRGFRADAVLGMGGFTSLPPLYAGRKLHLRTLLHESNAYPGKANRMSAKFCDRVLLGLADCAPHFPAGKTRVVGTPLRAALRDAMGQAVPDAADSLAFFGLDAGKSTLLVMGGSQGARGVNDHVCAALPALNPAAVQVIHLTGPADIERVRTVYANSPLRAHVAPFCQRMELAYPIATAAICRSGASSLTELSAFGVPTILIPYPFAADDHQTKNAEVFVRAKAALMVQERDLNAGRMAGLLNDLLGDASVRNSLGANLRALAVTDAAERVCKAIEDLASTPR